jgi:hypothetical protein
MYRAVGHVPLHASLPLPACQPACMGLVIVGQLGTCTM